MAKISENQINAHDPETRSALEGAISSFLARKLPEKKEDKLLNKILFRIEKAERRSLLIKKSVFAGILAFSLIGGYLAFHSFQTALAHSGLLQYISLLASDTAVILGDWKNYTYSLIESMPVAEITWLLAFLWLAVFSLKNIFDSLAGAHKHHNFVMHYNH